ncbi:MAG: Peptidase-C39-2 domain-containing protein [Oscillospiraceae bacterium]
MANFQHRKILRRRIFYICLLVIFSAAASFMVSFYFDKTANADITPSEESAVESETESASESDNNTSSSQAEQENPLHMIPVAHISGENQLSTGCELVSAMMLLNHYGISTTADQIVSRTPKVSLLSEGGSVYGMSPNQAFIGDPRSSDGLGCYATVLTAVVNSYFWDNDEKEAVNLTGTELTQLAQDYLSKGSPVIIWATVDMKDPTPGPSWILADTNETFQWISGEHCLLMVGFDEERYYFNDPYDLTGVKSYSKSVVEERYRQMGKQAVAVRDIADAAA